MARRNDKLATVYTGSIGARPTDDPKDAGEDERGNTMDTSNRVANDEENSSMGDKETSDNDVELLTAHQEADNQAFLKEQLAAFAGMMGDSNIAQHSITMWDNRSVNKRCSPRNPAMQQIINQQVD